MRINNNITALNAHRNYGINNASIAKNVEKLSSGYRINRAGDDAAGLAISEKMRAQIRGLNMASKNSQDAVSLVQTAEGALQSTHNILQRMRELAVQSSSDTNEQIIDRGALQQEFAALKAEIDDIASKTVFNDQKLIDGTFEAKYKSATITTDLNGSSIMLSNAAKAGTYNITVKQETTGYVAPKAATAAGDIGTTNDLTAVAFDITADLKTARFNGTWELRASGNDLIAYNTRTGEAIKGDIDMTNDDTNDGTGVEITFGGLGTMKIQTDASYDLTNDQLASFVADAKGATFTVSDGKDYDRGITKYYATIEGSEKKEVKVGDTHVTFDNGITVKLSAALTSSDLELGSGTGISDTATAAASDAAFTAPVKLAGAINISEREGRSLTIQTGANQGDELSISIDKMDTQALGISLSFIGNRLDASKSITEVNNALNQVSTQRAALGALQNRLEYKIANLDTSAENLQAAESRIRDVDMAKEMTNFMKNNILAQASTAMLAQANSLPQGVLQLLG